MKVERKQTDFGEIESRRRLGAGGLQCGRLVVINGFEHNDVLVRGGVGSMSGRLFLPKQFLLCLLLPLCSILTILITKEGP